MDERIGFPDIPQVGSVESGHPVSITGIVEALRPTGSRYQRCQYFKLRREDGQEAHNVTAATDKAVNITAPLRHDNVLDVRLPLTVAIPGIIIIVERDNFTA